MRVTPVEDYDRLSDVAAGIVMDLVRRKPDAVIALPAGGTPVGMYQRLVNAYGRAEIDFSRVKLLDIDTVKAPREEPHTHYSYIVQHLVSKVNLRKENWFVLDPMPADPESFCRSYDEKVRLLGGIDLVMDGLGHNGHFGYNEPGSSFGSATREVTIAERTRRANARWYKDLSEVPSRGFTMGIRTISGASEIVILVSGRDKAEIVRRVCEGPICEEVPMTVIRTHGNSRMIVDFAAATLLTWTTKRRIQNQEPL